MDFLRPVRAFDDFQQRHKPLAIPLAVVKKFGDDQAGNLAALVSYYAFFSLFPILLVFTTILGYIFQGDPHTQHSVEHAIRSQVPAVGQYIPFNSLTGSVAAIVIGTITSLLAGLGVTNAAQQAFDRVWAVPMKARPDFLRARLRGIGLLVVLGTLFIAATVIGGVVSGGFGGPLAKVAGIVISLALNVLLFLTAFRLMTSSTVATRCLWVGVVVAAVFWEILQLVGGIYVKHVLAHSSHYGIFGTVIALLLFLHLGAQLTLYAAEVNVVVTRNLWPRSLLGPPQVDADKETLAALAKVEERHDTERVEVQFEDEAQNS